MTPSPALFAPALGPCCSAPGYRHRSGKNRPSLRRDCSRSRGGGTAAWSCRGEGDAVPARIFQAWDG